MLYPHNLILYHKIADLSLGTQFPKAAEESLAPVAHFYPYKRFHLTNNIPVFSHVCLCAVQNPGDSSGLRFRVALSLPCVLKEDMIQRNCLNALCCARFRDAVCSFGTMLAVYTLLCLFWHDSVQILLMVYTDNVTCELALFNSADTGGFASAFGKSYQISCVGSDDRVWNTRTLNACNLTMVLYDVFSGNVSKVIYCHLEFSIW